MAPINTQRPGFVQPQKPLIHHKILIPIKSYPYFCARHPYDAKYSVKDSRKDPLILVEVMTKEVGQNRW
jgi:hypothetical protein